MEWFESLDRQEKLVQQARDDLNEQLAAIQQLKSRCSKTGSHGVCVDSSNKPDNDYLKILPDGRVTAKDAALYCGLSIKTMAMKRSQGSGPKYIKQGRIFYNLKDLDRWMVEGEGK